MINWKLRFKNKTTLVAMCGALVTFIYQMLSLLGVTPKVSQNEIVQLIGLIINILVAMGIITDPTTKGVADSDTALGYKEPR